LFYHLLALIASSNYLASTNPLVSGAPEKAAQSALTSVMKASKN